jgi:hypothetical protein
MADLTLERFDGRAKLAICRAQQIADRERHREISPVHLLRTLLADDTTFAFAEKRGGDPKAGLAKAVAHSHAALDSGTASFGATLLALVRAAEDVAAGTVMVGDLFVAAHRTLSGDELALFELAVGPLHSRAGIPLRNDRPKDPEDAGDWRDDDESVSAAPLRFDPGPDAEERFVGALRPSAHFLRILGTLEDAHEKLQPWAPWLPFEAVVRAERELGTTLPDDFWAAVAARLPAFARAGIAATPHGDPAHLDSAAEIVLEASAEAQVEVDDDLVVFIDRREIEEGKGDFVAVSRGVAFAERNRAPVYVVSASGSRRAPYPSFADLLDSLVSDEHAAERFGVATVSFSPTLGHPPQVVPQPVATPLRVGHAKFGLGTVVGRSADAGETKLDIAFDDGKRRVLLARFVEDV